MQKNEKLFWLFFALALITVTADASTVANAVGGAANNGGAAAATDAYGFGAIFTKVAGIIEDNGLGKIIGIIGGISALIVIYGGRIVGGIVVVVITMAFAYLPQIVDKMYGAII